MKPSFKTTTLIAAIGMIVYTFYMVTRYVIHELYPATYCFDLWTDIRTRIAFDILPLSFIVACLALYKRRPTMSASKPFLILTISLLIALVGTLVFCYPNTIQVCGVKYLYPSIYWRVLMLIAGIVWLFMLRKQPTLEPSPRSYRVILIIAMCVLALPIILEIISGISLLLNGHIYCFSSYAIKSWTRWIAPVLPFVHFVFPSLKQINTTRNTHCTHGSFDEKTFNHNRKVTLIFVGITIIAFLVCWICFRLLHDLFFRLNINESISNMYKVFEFVAQTSALITLISLIISWIMLSFMAFRQLPNPRGYKIYNIICQSLTWGSVILWMILSIQEIPLAEIFRVLFLIAFCAFFITQTIRVISYKLPE